MCFRTSASLISQLAFQQPKHKHTGSKIEFEATSEHKELVMEMIQNLALRHGAGAEREPTPAVDGCVFSVPMYNFSVPFSFKAYTGQIVRVGRTFSIVQDGEWKELVEEKKSCSSQRPVATIVPIRPTQSGAVKNLFYAQHSNSLVSRMFNLFMLTDWILETRHDNKGLAKHKLVIYW